MSKITLIFKKGDSKKLEHNYCLISIVPIFSKIFESILYNQLSSFFVSHNSISSSQYGFCQGESTTLAVLNKIHHSLEAFEKKFNSLGHPLLYDLSKAFDKFLFNILIDKTVILRCDSSFKFIKSYFSNLSKIKALEWNWSPQGSILGFFLYIIIIINDLPKHLNTHSIVLCRWYHVTCANHYNLNSNYTASWKKCLWVVLFK